MEFKKIETCFRTLRIFLGFGHFLKEGGGGLFSRKYPKYQEENCKNDHITNIEYVLNLFIQTFHDRIYNFPFILKLNKIPFSIKKKIILLI